MGSAEDICVSFGYKDIAAYCWSSLCNDQKISETLQSLAGAVLTTEHVKELQIHGWGISDV